MVDRIVLVTSEGKEATETYFKVSPTLEAALAQRGSAKLDDLTPCKLTTTSVSSARHHAKVDNI